MGKLAKWSPASPIALVARRVRHLRRAPVVSHLSPWRRPWPRNAASATAAFRSETLVWLPDRAASRGCGGGATARLPSIHYLRRSHEALGLECSKEREAAPHECEKLDVGNQGSLRRIESGNSRSVFQRVFFEAFDHTSKAIHLRPLLSNVPFDVADRKCHNPPLNPATPAATVGAAQARLDRRAGYSRVVEKKLALGVKAPWTWRTSRQSAIVILGLPQRASRRGQCTGAEGPGPRRHQRRITRLLLCWERQAFDAILR